MFNINDSLCSTTKLAVAVTGGFTYAKGNKSEIKVNLSD